MKRRPDSLPDDARRLPLFETPHNNTPTSIASNRRAVESGRTAKVRDRYLALAERAGPAGLTDEEAQERLGLRGSTLRPTRWVLNRDGRVLLAGRRRGLRSGNRGEVWIHASFGTEEDRARTKKWIEHLAATRQNRAWAVTRFREWLQGLEPSVAAGKVNAPQLLAAIDRALSHFGLVGAQEDQDDDDLDDDGSAVRC